MDNMLYGGIQDIQNNAFSNSTGQVLVQPNVPQGINQLNTSTPVINGYPEQVAASTTTVTTSAKALWRVDLKDSCNGRKSYVATVVLYKDDKQSVDAISYAINTAKNHGFKNFGDNWQCNKLPLHDGDKEIPGNANPENYKGRYYLYARSYLQPIIVDAKGDMLQDNHKVYKNLPTSLYSLYEEPVSVRFFPYNNQNAGISCSLRALMVVNSADHFTGERALTLVQDAFSQYLKY